MKSFTKCDAMQELFHTPKADFVSVIEMINCLQWEVMLTTSLIDKKLKHKITDNGLNGASASSIQESN